MYLLVVVARLAGNSISLIQTDDVKQSFVKPAGLPVTDRSALIAASPNEQLADQLLYQQAVRRLMWISNSTRFDIAYVVSLLSQHCNKPAIRHWNGVIQVLRYLSGTRILKLRIGGDKEQSCQLRL